MTFCHLDVLSELVDLVLEVRKLLLHRHDLVVDHLLHTGVVHEVLVLQLWVVRDLVFKVLSVQDDSVSVSQDLELQLIVDTLQNRVFLEKVDDLGALLLILGTIDIQVEVSLEAIYPSSVFWFFACFHNWQLKI